MNLLAVVVIGTALSVTSCIGDASAQRGQSSRGIHSPRANSAFGGHGAGMVHARHHIGTHRDFRSYRTRWLYGAAPVVVNEPGQFSSDNCWFEERSVWNGLATLREIVTVCR